MTINQLATELSITASDVRKIIQGLQPQRVGISDNDPLVSADEISVRYVQNVRLTGNL